MSDYTSMNTIDLRGLVRTRGLAKGAAVASARKEDLIALLTGEKTALDIPEPAVCEWVFDGATETAWQYTAKCGCVSDEVYDVCAVCGKPVKVREES